MLPRPHYRRLRSFRWWRLALFSGLGVLGLGLLIGLTVFWYFSQTIPTLEEIANRQISQSTKIYDRTGKVLLYQISAGQKRTIVPFEDIPDSLKNATIAIEDERFYTEPAFDWRGYLRAVWVNLSHGEIRQGGSTITIQLARNAFLTTEQTWTRKVRELILAIRLSQQYSKDQILGLYLNEVPYGPTIYGVESASSAFFNTSTKNLTLAQSAILASIPKGPTYYSPWGSHTKELLARGQTVLKKMRSLGMISDADLAKAVSEKIVFQPQGLGIKAPHFVLAVQDYLVKKYGEDAVRSGGLSVITTLDWKLQEAAEKAVADGAAKNEKAYDGKNAALVAEDPATGHILAMVGSRDYFDQKNDGNFNVATQGLRQPGSTLKPFVYMTGFQKGYTPETVLFDVPTEFVPNNPSCPQIPDLTKDKDPGSPCFHPQNFDLQFLGPVPIRTDLAQSRNIPAVEMLYLAGLPDVLKNLQMFGITTLTDPSRYGLSLVLGGGEVHLNELVGAYSILSQEGTHHDQAAVLEVRDATGRILESYEDKSFQAIDPQYPRLINNILSDTNARAGLFGGSLGLTIFPDHDVALKTGTSNDYRDAWAMGYTPSLVVGVWAGNNDNTPMHRQGSSILAAVPIWSAFMTQALKDRPSESFVKPDIVPPIRPILGGDYAPGGQVHTILYWVDKNDPIGAQPTNPGVDPQFWNWEMATQAWYQMNPDKTAGLSGTQAVVPAGEPGVAPGVRLESPTAGSHITGNDVTLWIRTDAKTPVVQMNIYWNGALLKTLLGDTGGNTLISLIPPSFKSTNLLEVEVVGVGGARNRVSATLYR